MKGKQNVLGEYDEGIFFLYFYEILTGLICTHRQLLCVSSSPHKDD